MSVSMYTVSIPVFMQHLNGLSGVLDKAAAWASERKIEPEALLKARLAPDMFHLTRQVQIACDSAKGGVARLAGVEIPKHEDNETSIADLKARIAKTIAFLKTLDRKAFAGAEDKHIVLKFPTNTFEFNGADYLGKFVLPNVYFHITTAYGILRNRGRVLHRVLEPGGIVLRRLLNSRFAAALARARDHAVVVGHGL
mgnify:CR=1 FL=1